MKDPEQIKILEEYFEIGTLDRIKKELSWIKYFSGLIDELTEISNATKEVEDIKKWSRQSIGVSLFQKRKVLFAA